MFESQNPEKINIKNLSFDKPEKEGETPEELREEFNGFLSAMFGEWYSDAKIKARIPEAVDHLPELITPQDQHWQEKKDDVDASKFGEYTINPETIDIDWKAVPPEKIKIEKLPDDWNGESIADVAEYIIKTYGADYYILGLEYYKYILENPDKSPKDLEVVKPKASGVANWNFFFGSILCSADGHWGVPYMGWVGATRYLGAEWLKSGWSASCRVVLLEKSAAVRKQRKDFLKPTPPMPEVRKF